MDDPKTAAQVLQTALALIGGDRAEQYGSFPAQMVSIAQVFNALKGPDGTVLCASDIALILMIMKLKRNETSNELDSLIDLCGYAALYAEAFKT